jgi:hypothetical protein
MCSPNNFKLVTVHFTLKWTQPISETRVKQSKKEQWHHPQQKQVPINHWHCSKRAYFVISPWRLKQTNPAKPIHRQEILKTSDCPDSSVNNVASYGTKDCGKERIRCYSPRPDKLCAPPSLLTNEHRRLFPRTEDGRNVKLTTHLHLVPSLQSVGLAYFPYRCGKETVSPTGGRKLNRTRCHLSSEQSISAN